ncbi:hypothetical protein WG66_011913 [Moniliophthora roreri]|nr:hypothetical protein WG66_011913 [Moniliophthora roreri]
MQPETINLLRMLPKETGTATSSLGRAVGPAKTITQYMEQISDLRGGSIHNIDNSTSRLFVLSLIGTGRVAMIRTPIKGVINASDLHARRFSDEDALTTITFMEMFMIVQIQFQSLCPHTTA